MAARKQPNGVQATIERITGKTPCPEGLRNSLNKYLYEASLFPGARRIPHKKQGKLSGPDTDVLVANLLALDEAFRGDTETVTRIASGAIPVPDLKKKISETATELQRRLDVYAYWVQRIRSLEGVLADESFDISRDRLDQRLVAATDRTAARKTTPFALRAIQILEGIEERGRLGKPTADEFAERADAYFALEDYDRADQNAREALALDDCHARAWFVRVMVALRQRNDAIKEMTRYQMTAQEIAEPMSSQESWALHMADEASCNASAHHQNMEAILPQALLHWPRADVRNYYHPEQRSMVRDLFIDHAFQIATTPGRYRSIEQYSRLNGFGPEWELERDNKPYMISIGFVEEELPFKPAEFDALKLIISERDQALAWYFHPFDGKAGIKSFKLLHLRWLLKLEGYSAHWKDITEVFEKHEISRLEEYLFRDSMMSRLWAHHQCINGNEQAALLSIREWQKRSAARDDGQRAGVLLEQFALLFHRHFVRKEFRTCRDIARHAGSLLNVSYFPRGATGNMKHPLDGQIHMPVHQPLYWRYLEAITLVSDAKLNDNLIEDDVWLLLEACSLQAAFSNTITCFWVESEEYEEGGGDDWPVEPYGIDLREAEPWQHAIGIGLSSRLDSETSGALKEVAAKLCSARLSL